MGWNFKKRKKNKKKMSQQFSFTNFLDKKWQIKQNHTEFLKGEILDIREYVTIEDVGFLVTLDKRKIKEADAHKLLVKYNPNAPALPIFERNQSMVQKTSQTQPFSLDVPSKQSGNATVQKVQQKSNIFSVFDNDSTNLSLKVSVNLPKLTLIKEMYKNAKDKEDFLNHLTTHVKKDVTDKIIQESLKELLEKRNYSKKTKKIKNDANTNKTGEESSQFKNQEEK